VARPSLLSLAASAALASAIAASFTAPAAAQVTVILEQFGVGNVFRPGDWTAIRVQLRSDAPAPLPVRLAWDVPDADGDLASSTRSLVLSPGQATSRWLYGRLPPAASPLDLEGEVFTLRVFEELEGERGRELAVARVSPATAAVPARGVALQEDLLGAIGTGRMGLEAYETPPPGLSTIPSINEMAVVTSGLGSAGLPDRWEGLASHSALVWGGDDPNTRPGGVGIEEGRALREWIARGGTLVIVLPETGNPWMLGTTGAAGGRGHFLSDLLPSTAPEIREGVLVREMLPALSKLAGLRDMTARMSVRTFDPTTLDAPWIPRLAFPAPHAPRTGLVLAEKSSIEGKVLAIERPFGFGRISIVGLDLDALRRRALQDGGLPQADCIWNPLLGRRGDSLTAAEYASLEKSEPPRLVRRPADLADLGGGSLIARPIELSGRAALGILAALGLFGTYWLLAGPLGFAVLRRWHRERWSWLVAVGVAAVFTVIAWAGSLAIRQGETRIEHLTFLDHVARPPSLDAALAAEPQFQRAASWFSASLPGYGTASIAIDPDGNQRNILSSWLAPPGDARGRFPDVRRYEASIDSPGVLEIPARATSTTLAANWLGPVDPAWGRLPWIDPEAPVEVLVDGASGKVSLRGRLLHDLKGTLADVKVIHVNPYRAALPSLLRQGGVEVVAKPGAMPQEGRFVAIAAWNPGEVLDLAAALYPEGAAPARDAGPSSLATSIKARYYDPLAAQRGFFGSQPDLVTQDESTRRLDMLSIYSMLAPPPYLQNPPTGVEPLRIERIVAREVDLSPWLARPCLIVIGYLRGSAIPLPVTIDGEAPPSSGLTVVRWILPLPAVEAAMVPDPRPAPNAD